MQNRTYYILGGIIVFLFIILSIWFFFFRSTGTLSTDGNSPSSLFGNTPDTANTQSSTDTSNGTQTINTTVSSQQKIFKITDGPIVGATLIQTLRPTTTLARYIRQDDGHVYDVPLGVAGAVPRIVSNVTIPGGQRAIWLEGGSAALLQYVDDSNIVKTVYMGFPVATTSGGILPTRLQFLPDNIIDIAASPDGKSVAYLIKTASGSDGYLAKSDGTSSKKAFSLPLSQMLMSWPSEGTILVQTKSAAGVTGMAFSVETKTGNVSQLVTAQGITASADPAFKRIVYTISDNTKMAAYDYRVSTKLNNPVSPTIFPEKCIWNKSINISLAYCAVPNAEVGNRYLDAWHAGTQTLADNIWQIDFNGGVSSILAIPGTKQGGVLSDIFEMALSPNEKYLSFTTKGARALWGVLLGN
jgi:hypothetical protein